MYKRSRYLTAPVSSTSSVQYSTARKSIVLSGREYIDTVSTPAKAVVPAGGFICEGDQLRPTDSKLFSWLSSIALKFEEYRFLSLQFTYEPQCATTTAGSVSVWFDGDPTHENPSDWNSVINTGSNVHGAPWAKHVFPVPRSLYGGRKKYYTKNEFPDCNADISIFNDNPIQNDPLGS